MKINSETSALFASQRIQAENRTSSVEKTSSFAAVMAGKTSTVGTSEPTQTAPEVKKYDFSNMSPKEAKDVMNDLILSGKMSIHESSSLAGMIPSPLSKVDYDGGMPDTFNQPWNFFTKIQEGIEGALSRGDKANAENLQRTSDMLMRFQGRPSKIDIQA